MNVLVVGGAGYIGSVTVEELLKNKHQVTVLDNLSRGHRKAVPAEAVFVPGDLGDAKVLEALFAKTKFDAVMHFAAHSLVGESVEQPALYFKNNVSNGLVLLDTMIKHDVKKFVFSSTAATYGEPQVSPITEDVPNAPTNPYGDSKLAFEKVLKAYARAYGLMYAALRYFNAAGATEKCGEDHSPETHLIAVLMQVANGERSHITIFGDDYATKDGTCVRDYIHVVDLADAHLKAVENLKTPGQSDIFNLGNGNGFTVNEVLEAARKVTGHKIPAQIGPRRPGDPANLVASSQKIKQTLGWNPKRAQLSDIIGDAWQWKQANPQGYGE